MSEEPALLAEGREALGRAMRSEGGWGYRPSGQRFVEPTALALLALSPEKATAGAAGSDVVSASLAALLACRKPEGFFGASAEDPDPSWATAPATLALMALGEVDRARQSARWLATWKAPADSYLTEKFLAQSKEWLHVDQSIPGWPWAGDAFATVEPTSLGALALAACGDVAPERKSAALRYLQDRACPGGGWNYGNPYFLETPLEPMTMPTAKALLALLVCGGRRDDAVVTAGFTVLAELLRENPSRKAHGWGALAFAARADEERALFHARAAIDPGEGRGPWGGAPDSNAVALLALRAALGRAPSCLTPKSA